MLQMGNKNYQVILKGDEFHQNEKLKLNLFAVTMQNS